VSASRPWGWDSVRSVSVVTLSLTVVRLELLTGVRLELMTGVRLEPPTGAGLELLTAESEPEAGEWT
jgi:hypothetical protein